MEFEMTEFSTGNIDDDIADQDS